MSQFQVCGVDTKEGFGFLVKGKLDQDADFDGITRCNRAEFFIELEGVERINSFGVKVWVNLISSLKEKRVTLRGCPVCFVDQLNIFEDFLGTCVIESLFLPFYCDTCNKEKDVKIDMQTTRQPNFREALNQMFPCPNCGKNQTFFDDIDAYFNFLNYL